MKRLKEIVTQGKRDIRILEDNEVAKNEMQEASNFKLLCENGFSEEGARKNLVIKAYEMEADAIYIEHVGYNYGNQMPGRENSRKKYRASGVAIFNS